MTESERTEPDDPVIEEGRRVAFVICQAERALSIGGTGGLKDRLTAILEGAMLNPRAIDPRAYSVAYRLWERAAEQPAVMKS